MVVEAGQRSEANFVANMKRLREARGWSQTEFAKRLNERGLPYHQPTIQRVESGDRVIRLDEALVIADELGVSFMDMFNPTQTSRASELMTEVGRAGDEIADAVERYLSLQFIMGVELENAFEHLPADKQAVARWLSRRTPMDIVASTILQRKARHEEVFANALGTEVKELIQAGHTESLAGAREYYDKYLGPRERGQLEEADDGEHQEAP